MKSFPLVLVLLLAPVAFADSTYTISFNVQQESVSHPTATFGLGTLLPDPYTGTMFEFTFSSDVGFPLTQSEGFQGFQPGMTVYFCDGCNVPLPGELIADHQTLQDGMMTFFIPDMTPGYPGIYTIGCPGIFDGCQPGPSNYYEFGALDISPATALTDPVSAPEPSTIVLLGVGILGLLTVLRPTPESPAAIRSALLPTLRE